MARRGANGAKPPAILQPLFTRTDAQVDFNWWDKAPRADLNADDFGVRWTGFLRAPASGPYQLGGYGRNTFEIYLDGKLVTSHNSLHEAAYSYAAVELEAGKLYSIRIDYHKYLGDARMRLLWSRPAGAEHEAALKAARQADAVVLVLGLSPRLEGEEMRVPVEGFKGGDRIDIGLPAAQQKTDGGNRRARQAGGAGVAERQRAGRELGARSRARHREAWYPGEAGGDAIADSCSAITTRPGACR